MKLSKKIISILLALCFVTGGMIPVTADGETSETNVWDGTKDTDWYTADSDATVFRIDTAEELAGLAAIVNGEIDDVSETFSGKTIILDADITLYSGNAEDWKTKKPTDISKSTEYGWTPIGYTDEQHYTSSASPKTITYTVANSFQGAFDGNGHTVSGIYYSRDGFTKSDGVSTTNVAGIGLFGFANGATIKRLRVENSYLNGNLAIGGIVGWATNTAISDCYSDAKIKVSNLHEGDLGGYGGILGFGVGGTGVGVTVSGCWFDGEIYRDSNTYSKNTGAGSSGIIGTISNVDNAIDSCLVTGSISGTTQVGGVVGKCNAISGKTTVTINNTLMLGFVSALRNNDATYAGEFIGIVMSNGTASMMNVYGKSDFKITLNSDNANNNTVTGKGTYVWSTNGTGKITDWAQNATNHRKTEAELKALVGAEGGLAVGEWAVVEGKNYPIPAYFAPAQFLGVQFADVDGDTYNVRFVGTIDTIEGYSKVGFEILLWDGTSPEALKYDLEDATVYTTILAGTSSGIDEKISVDGKYLIALTIMGALEEYDEYQIRTFVSDGTNKIYGKTVTMTRPDTWNQ